MLLNTLFDQQVRPLSYTSLESLAEFRIIQEYTTKWMILCLTEGEVVYNIENTGEYCLKAGEILICPPFCNWEKKIVKPISGCILFFESDVKKRPQLGRIVYKINTRIYEDLEMISKLDDTDTYGTTLQMDIWHQLCNMYKKPSMPVKENHYESPIQSLLDYIDRSIAEKITLDSLAEQVGYSKAMLIQKFKYHTGSTPMEYVTDVRINHVKKMMSGSRRMTLREIAYKSGFANEFYLSNVFRRRVGVSPSEYRKTIYYDC